LHGQIQDPEFLRFLEEIGRERLAAFSIEDFLVLDLVHREQRVPAFLKPRLEPLMDQGIIERIGRGRGVRYLLSRRFYGSSASLASTRAGEDSTGKRTRHCCSGTSRTRAAPAPPSASSRRSSPP
jgi:hypothetical protein